MKLHLTSRFSLTFGLLVALLLTTVGMLSYRSGSEGLKAAAVAGMLGNAVEKEAELDLWIEERLNDIRLLASHVHVVEKADKLVTSAYGSEAERSAHAVLLQEFEPFVTAPGSAFIELFVMEPEKGKVLASTSPAEEGKSEVGHPFFEQGKTSLYLQAPYHSSDIRAPIITIGVPLRTNDGRVVAVLAARLNLSVLNTILLRRTGLHQTEDAFLVNAEQYPVTQPRFIKESEVLRRKFDSEAVRLCASRNSGVILAPDYRGVPSIAVYRWNTKHNLGLIVKIDQSEALAPARTFGRAVVLISILALFITGGLAFLLARTIKRPLRSLQESLSRFAEGNIEEPLPESSGDEVGLLARAFNQMVVSVKERTSELTQVNEALQMEIAERKAGETERARLIAIIESTTDMVAIADPDGHIIYANKACCAALVDVGSGEDITKTVITEFHVDLASNPSLTVGIPAATRTGTWSGESSLLSRSGREIPISQVILAHKTPDGQIEYLSTIMRDITERKQMEESLREVEQRLTHAMSLAQLYEWEYEVASGLFFFSDHYFTLHGTTSELEGGNVMSAEAFAGKFVHPDDAQVIGKNIAKAIATNDPDHSSHLEIRVFRRDREIRHISVDYTITKDVEGRTIKISGVNQDITDRKRSDEALKTAKAFTESTLDSIIDIFYAFDLKGKFLSWNKTFSRISGYSDQELSQKKPTDFFSSEDIQHVTESIERIYNEGSSKVDAHFVLCDGRQILCEFTGSVLTDGDGTIIGFSGTGRDITERKSVADELQKAKAAAESANRAKSVFLSNMSHELRTPLNAILGFSRLMRDGASVTAEQREALDIINRSGEHLLNLINDVLDMAKIEAGHVSVKNAPFDLGGMLRDVIDLMAGRAAEKNLELRLDQSSEFPRFVRADGNKLRQVLLNLVGNAIKFTQQGHVELRLSTLIGDSPQCLRLIIEVEDTGTGIAAEDLPLVFEPFIRVGKQALQKGTGLGLAIARQQVELMGGWISVESTPGTGSLFRMELPVDRVDASEVAAVKTDPGRVVGLVPGQPEYRILIVEDQMENWLLLQRLLEGVCFQVRVAQDGRAGIEMFQAWRPHCILMDIRMPVMDGREATRSIRSLDGGREVKIVVVTASVFEDDLDNIMAEEIDDYIRKPYRPEEIYACLAKHLGVKFVTEEPQTPVATGPSDVLDHEALAALPSALCIELADAVVNLDAERIAGLIGRVSELDPLLGGALALHAGRYSYSTILQALQAGRSHIAKEEAR